MVTVVSNVCRNISDMLPTPAALKYRTLAITIIIVRVLTLKNNGSTNVERLYL